MSRARLMSMLGQKPDEEKPRTHTKRTRDGEDIAKLKAESNKGWKLYKELLVTLRLRDMADKIQRFVLATWIIFYAFLKDFNILNRSANDFLSREEVVAGGAFIISWLIYRVYRMGPLWVGVFTAIALIVTILTFIL